MIQSTLMCTTVNSTGAGAAVLTPSMPTIAPVLLPSIITKLLEAFILVMEATWVEEEVEDMDEDLDTMGEIKEEASMEWATLESQTAAS